MDKTTDNRVAVAVDPSRHVSLMNLPDELIIKIFERLPQKDLLTMSRVSREGHRLSWEQLYTNPAVAQSRLTSFVLRFLGALDDRRFSLPKIVKSFDFEIQILPEHLYMEGPDMGFLRSFTELVDLTWRRFRPRRLYNDEQYSTWDSVNQLFKNSDLSHLRSRKSRNTRLKLVKITNLLDTGFIDGNRCLTYKKIKAHAS